MMPQIHPRTMIVQKARNDMRAAALELVEEHELTSPEYLGILAEMIQVHLKYMLRAERHPDDPDRPADRA